MLQCLLFCQSLDKQSCVPERYQELEAATGAQSELREEHFLPVQVKNISTVSIVMLKRLQHRHLGNHQEGNLLLKAVCVTSERKTCLSRKLIFSQCYHVASSAKYFQMSKRPSERCGCGLWRRVEPESSSARVDVVRGCRR